MNNINLQLFASADYWRKREEDNLKRNLLAEKEYEQEIQRIYKDMLDSVQGEIDRFYRQYAKKENITLSEAKKRVSKLDMERYERKAEKYVKAAAEDRAANGGNTNKRGYYFSDKANEEMRLYNLTMKVNRLEMLKSNIGLELIKGHAELETFMADMLQGRTEAELERQAGILGETIIGNAKTAHAIVNASFKNATFSDRIWAYHGLMKNDLAKMLQSGLIQGKNPRVMANDMRKYFIGEEYMKNGKKGAVYNAERLMWTELARVQTEAQEQSFIRNGFEEYTFHALSNCCDICAAISGKHFKVKNMMPGENAPPVHPHCRCSTSAYEDSKEYDAWLDYLSQGGNTAEWEKSGKAAWQKTGTVMPKDSKAKEPSFAPAKTIEEAKDYATNKLGLFRADYDKMQLDFANMLNKEVARVYDTFGNLNSKGRLESIIIWPKRANWYAAYSSSSKLIGLRNVASKGVMKKWAKDAAEQFKAGFWSTNATEHVIRHELGHAVQHMILDNNAGKLNRIQLLHKRILRELDIDSWSVNSSESDKLKASKHISYYALRNEGELIAESVAEYMAGNPRPVAKKVIEILISDNIDFDLDEIMREIL